ncbi:MAG: hypothetical protein AB7O37_18165 [Vicinamibacteria bacterium]
MRTLVYKRTHEGDPDQEGRFGINDCMGTVRARKFDAVIGVGGTGAKPRRNGIAKRITWIGIGPHKSPGKRGPVVTFDHFRMFGKGPFLAEYAPALADHIYGRNVRSLMNPTPRESAEIAAILNLARNAPPSRALARRPGARRAIKCLPTRQPSARRRC